MSKEVVVNATTLEEKGRFLGGLVAASGNQLVPSLGGRLGKDEIVGLEKKEEGSSGIRQHYFTEECKVVDGRSELKVAFRGGTSGLMFGIINGTKSVLNKHTKDYVMVEYLAVSEKSLLI
ncbi:hypothetical protein BCR34DRAFT_598991 [Clohesyomyces aquaticus]|uniref:Uncharacterized protein n=1 Tax=Clohesyomyces aquaticus TaxID=1231657 RepID=A0A1Y1ZWS8_9PLEO|nr:hypothetical protein BCR34DRAFT_598991 [Clohesyomyces aquaticus]